MKKFLKILLSDSNRYSIKRFIGLLCLIMFMTYGVAGLFVAFNLEFWIFYVSLCTITIWIAFKFMSAEKILKYNVIEKLTRFNAVKDVVEDFTKKEDEVDDNMQLLSGDTPTQVANTE